MTRLIFKVNLLRNCNSFWFQTILEQRKSFCLFTKKRLINFIPFNPDILKRLMTSLTTSIVNKSSKLSGSTSPYLRQHANNPVEWYPWGEESLKLAKNKNKPIFLSIGYSTCHWCHVMAHESFEK